jgi:hypothetical protein
MRASVTKRHFSAVTQGGFTRRKASLHALLLACAALLTACPPEGGDLVPLEGGEGAQLVTTKFERDTLSLTRAGVTMKARGLWTVSGGGTSVILDVSNANPEAATIDFGRTEMVNNDGGQRLSLRSVSREVASGVPVVIPERAVQIEGGQTAKFTLEFASADEDARSSVSRNLPGHTATLRVHTENESATPAQVDFIFRFRYAESQRRS